MSRRRSIAAGLVAAAALLAGCGIEDPYVARQEAQQRQEQERPRTETATDARPHPDDRAPEDYTTATVPSGSDTSSLARAYGEASGNWSWTTYARQYDRMLALAGGPLREQLMSTPPDEGVLRTLRRVRQTNRAEVFALDVRGDTAIVVLRERAGAAGQLEETWLHNVYRARVGQTEIGPRVVAWERLQ